MPRARGRALGAIAALLAAGAALTALLSGACSQPAMKEAPRFLVGVSQANLSEPWRIAMTEEIRKESARYPGLRVIYADAADSSTRQIDDVRRLMGYKIDLLIVSPTDSRALTPIVREAYARIPVIVLDRAVEGFDYSLFIGPDNERLGREAGNIASGLLGRAGGNVLEIEGRSGSPPTLERSAGFREAIGERKKARMLSPIVADWLRDKAEDELAAHISALPPVAVVFAQNDAMAYGAWKAFSSAGRSGTRFIGIDGLPGPMGGIDLVGRGILDVTFTCPTGGKEAVIYGMDLLMKREGIPKKIYLRSRMVTSSNASDLLGEAEEQRAAPPAQGKPIVLGFSQVGSESEWRVANTKSIKAAAAKAGIQLLFEDGRQKQRNQIAAIRSFIQRKVDVIAFSPVVESGWDEVLREAKEAGIPVILSDRAIDSRDDTLWLSFLGSDFVEEGRRAARWVVETLKASGSVNIVELRGTAGSAPAIDRKIGFEEVIRDLPNYRIVASEDGDFTREQGYWVMKDILRRAHPRIDVVFAHNDDMALGAIDAMKESGLRPGEGIVVVSVDAAQGAFKAMLDGTLNCAVECSPLLGPQLMKAVLDYMSGKVLPIRMITSEGVFPASTARRDMVGREY